jgi:hypothetical protein
MGSGHHSLAYDLAGCRAALEQLGVPVDRYFYKPSAYERGAADVPAARQKAHAGVTFRCIVSARCGDDRSLKKALLGASCNRPRPAGR